MLKLAVEIFAGNAERKRWQDYKYGGTEKLLGENVEIGAGVAWCGRTQDHYYARHAECD